MKEDLYEKVILDHHRNPRHRGELDDPTHTGFEHNPLCGDRVGLHLRVREERIVETAFHGEGCAICMASASLLADAVRGEPVDEAVRLTDRLASFLREEDDAAGEAMAGAGFDELEALGSVRAYPIRVKCALLPWGVLRDAVS